MVGVNIGATTFRLSKLTIQEYRKKWSRGDYRIIEGTHHKSELYELHVTFMYTNIPCAKMLDEGEEDIDYNTRIEKLITTDYKRRINLRTNRIC